jgi:hypothetical protein
LQVLERGFHDSSINFIFHAAPPLSLRQYVQDTGRAGRDVGWAKCYLFYSPRGMTVAENVIFQNQPRDDDRKMKELNEVCLYAAEGGECRKWILSNHASLNGNLPKEEFHCEVPHLCDNCQWEIKHKSESLQNVSNTCVAQHEVSYEVREALEGVMYFALSKRLSLPEGEFKQELKKLLEQKISEASDACDKAATTAIRAMLVESLSPLFHDLVRLLRIDFSTMSCAPKVCVAAGKGQMQMAYTDWKSAERLVELLKQEDVRIFVRSTRLLPEEPIKPTYVECLEETLVRPKLGEPRGLRLENFTRSDTAKALEKEASNLPYLVQYELQRYDHSL